MAFLSLVLTFSSCEKENYAFGDIIAPANMVITPQIVGKDATHPYGDGSGTVNFKVTANNAITYKFIYNGEESIAPSGIKTYNFGNTGTHKYTITVVANGTAGISSSATIEVEVMVLYSPPADLLTMLTSNSSRTWRIEAETVGHFGVAPPDAVTSIWWSAPVNNKEGKGAYDDRFIFNINGTFTHNTNGTAYGQKGPMIADLGGDQGLTPNGDNEFENYPLANYSERWELSAPNGQETLSFSNKGYHGFYVGGNHKYVILSRTANTMYLRTVGADGNGWFVKFIAE